MIFDMICYWEFKIDDMNLEQGHTRVGTREMIMFMSRLFLTFWTINHRTKLQLPKNWTEPTFFFLFSTDVHQQKRFNSEYRNMIETILKFETFFYSYTYDITHTLQRLQNTTPEFLMMPLYERVKKRFVIKIIFYGLRILRSGKNHENSIEKFLILLKSRQMSDSCGIITW